MNELIKVNYNNEMPTVSGRDLHGFLEIETPYTQWFERMCDYDFLENVDFISLSQKCEKPIGGRPTINHQLTVDMAKEICMIQRTEKGKQARQYFISLEKAWNSPEQIMSRALKMADETIKSLQVVNSKLAVENQIMQPKADYFDELVDRNLLTSFRDTAKEFGVKEKDFISFLLSRKYIFRDKKDKLMPYADKNNGLFEVKEAFNSKSGWSGVQTLITPRGRETFRLLMAGVRTA